MMVLSLRSLVATVLVGALAVPAGEALAHSSGKIYAGGEWKDAETVSSPNVFSPLLAPLFAPLTQGLSQNNNSQVVLDFLAGNSLAVGGDLSAISWNEASVQTGPELETHRVKKIWNGIEVLGGEAVVHLQQGAVAFANADSTYLGHLVAEPAVSADDAERIAFSSYRGEALRTEAPALKVLILGNGDSREARLVYSVKVVDTDALSSDVHFIDAHSGQEALVTTNVHTAANRKVMAGTGSRLDMAIVSDANAEQLINERFTTIYSDSGCESSNGFSFWEGWKKRIEGNSAQTAASRECNSAEPAVLASASSAWENSGKVLAYYQNVHRWQSVDGRGAMVRSVVNFGGASFNNAAWLNERRIMLYGMGDGMRFNNFASSLDVVAHEITHGLTMSTSQLVYASESGALNESYSDVFGKLISFRSGDNDWKIGRGLFRDGGSYIRDMENPSVPHNRYFKFRGQACNRYNDFCGVHENSGIANRAAVLIAKRIGQEKLGRIYFLTLTQMLRSSSDFREARAQTEAACATLYRSGSTECRAVSESFEEVGI